MNVLLLLMCAAGMMRAPRNDSIIKNPVIKNAVIAVKVVKSPESRHFYLAFNDQKEIKVVIWNESDPLQFLMNKSMTDVCLSSKEETEKAANYLNIEATQNQTEDPFSKMRLIKGLLEHVYCDEPKPISDRNIIFAIYKTYLEQFMQGYLSDLYRSCASKIAIGSTVSEKIDSMNPAQALSLKDSIDLYSAFMLERINTNECSIMADMMLETLGTQHDTSNNTENVASNDKKQIAAVDKSVMNHTAVPYQPKQTWRSERVTRATSSIDNQHTQNNNQVSHVPPPAIAQQTNNFRPQPVDIVQMNPAAVAYQPPVAQKYAHPQYSQHTNSFSPQPVGIVYMNPAAIAYQPPIAQQYAQHTNSFYPQNQYHTQSSHVPPPAIAQQTNNLQQQNNATKPSIVPDHGLNADHHGPMLTMGNYNASHDAKDPSKKNTDNVLSAAATVDIIDNTDKQHDQGVMDLQSILTLIKDDTSSQPDANNVAQCRQNVIPAEVDPIAQNSTNVLSNNNTFDPSEDDEDIDDITVYDDMDSISVADHVQSKIVNINKAVIQSFQQQYYNNPSLASIIGFQFTDGALVMNTLFREQNQTLTIAQRSDDNQYQIHMTLNVKLLNQLEKLVSSCVPGTRDFNLMSNKEQKELSLHLGNYLKINPMTDRALISEMCKTQQSTFPQFEQDVSTNLSLRSLADTDISSDKIYNGNMPKINRHTWLKNLAVIWPASLNQQVIRAADGKSMIFVMTLVDGKTCTDMHLLNESKKSLIDLWIQIRKLNSTDYKYELYFLSSLYHFLYLYTPTPNTDTMQRALDHSIHNTKAIQTSIKKTAKTDDAQKANNTQANIASMCNPKRAVPEQNTLDSELFDIMGQVRVFYWHAMPIAEYVTCYSQYMPWYKSFNVQTGIGTDKTSVCAVFSEYVKVYIVDIRTTLSLVEQYDRLWYLLHLIYADLTRALPSGMQASYYNGSNCKEIIVRLMSALCAKLQHAYPEEFLAKIRTIHNINEHGHCDYCLNM